MLGSDGDWDMRQSGTTSGGLRGLAFSLTRRCRRFCPVSYTKRNLATDLCVVLTGLGAAIQRYHINMKMSSDGRRITKTGAVRYRD